MRRTTLIRLDVSVGSKPEILTASRCFPLYPQSGHPADGLGCPFSANNGLMQRRKRQLYSITSSARESRIGERSSPSAFAVLRLMINSRPASPSSGRITGSRGPAGIRHSHPLDDEDVHVNVGLAQPFQWGIVRVVVPRLSLFERRKLQHDDG